MSGINHTKRLQWLAYVTIAAGALGVLNSFYGRMQTGAFDHASVEASLGIALIGVLASMIAKILMQLGNRLNELSADMKPKANQP